MYLIAHFFIYFMANGNLVKYKYRRPIYTTYILLICVSALINICVTIIVFKAITFDTYAYMYLC